MAEPRHRYSIVSLILHWGIALLLVAQILLVSDANTDGPDARMWVGLHKSVGLTILVLTLARLAWRLANPAIPLPAETPRWQKMAARTTHVLFYVVLLALPMTGWLASSAGGRAIEWFGLFQWPLLPVGGGREAAGAFMDIHRAVVKSLYILIALHVLGALKHHFINRDNVLHRMIPLIPRRP